MTVNDRIFSIRRNKKKFKDKKITILEEVRYVNPETGRPDTMLRVVKRARAYARQIGASDIEGGTLLENPNFKHTMLFLLNWQDELEQHFFINYKKKLYKIEQIDYFEGYKKDIVVVATWKDV